MLELYKYTDSEKKKLLSSIVVMVDTREKDGHNDHILSYFDSKKIPWVKKALPYGDYSFYVPANEELNIPRDLDFSSQIIVERKANLDEFAANATADRDRIKKEFAQAPATKVLLIENATYGDMVNGNYRSQYSAKSYYGTIHSFWHEYNLPVVFMGDKNNSGKFIYGFLYYYLRNILK